MFFLLTFLIFKTFVFSCYYNYPIVWIFFILLNFLFVIIFQKNIRNNYNAIKISKGFWIPAQLLIILSFSYVGKSLSEDIILSSKVYSVLKAKKYYKEIKDSVEDEKNQKVIEKRTAQLGKMLSIPSYIAEGIVLYPYNLVKIKCKKKEAWVNKVCNFLYQKTLSRVKGEFKHLKDIEFFIEEFKKEIFIDISNMDFFTYYKTTTLKKINKIFNLYSNFMLKNWVIL